MYYTTYSSSNRGGGFSCWFMILYGYCREKREETIWEYTKSFHWFIDIFICYWQVLKFFVTRWCLHSCKRTALFFLPILILIDIILIIVVPIWFIVETCIILIILIILLLLLIIGNILLCCVPLIALMIVMKNHKKNKAKKERERALYNNLFRSMMAPTFNTTMFNTTTPKNGVTPQPPPNISETSTLSETIDTTTDIETDTITDTQTDTQTDVYKNTQDTQDVVINVHAYQNTILNVTRSDSNNTSDIELVDLNDESEY